MKEFGNPAVAVAPAGDRLAYVVKHQPPDYDRARATGDRFTPHGTPEGIVGMRIYLADAGGRQSTPLCAPETKGANTWRPSWSPNGSRLAFYSDVGGPPQLWVYEVETGDCRKVSDAAIRARHWTGDEAQWAADNKTAYVPLRPENLVAPKMSGTPRAAPIDLGREAAVDLYFGGSERKSAKESAAAGSGDLHRALYVWENNSILAAIDVETGAVRKIVGAKALPQPSVLRLSPSGKWLSYLSVFYNDSKGRFALHDLVFAPATGGEAQKLAEGLRVPNRSFDYYTQTYRWHPKQDRMVYLQDGRLWAVDFSDTGPGDPRPLARELGTLTLTPILFTPDGQSVLIGIDPVGDGTEPEADGKPRALALVPIDGGEVLRFGLGEEFAFEEALSATPGQLWQPGIDTVLIRATHRESGDTAILHIHVRSDTRKLLWRARARLGNLSAAQNGAIFAVYEDFATAPDVYRFSGTMSRKSRITTINPQLAGVEPGTAHLFETVIPLHDGSLRAVRTAVLMPPGMNPGDRPPGVVFVYPDRDYSFKAADYGIRGFPLPAGVLTTRGYAVVCPHIDIGPGDVPGNAIQEITDALLPQVYRAADLGYVDIRRMGVTGSSFGGYATAAVVSQTNLFRAAVPMNGIYDLGGNYGRFRNGPSEDAAMIHWTEHTQPRIGAHPWADLRRVIENSSYYNADKINTPVLIMQGADDASLVEAQKLFVALRRLDKPVQLAVYQGSGHVLYAWPRANAIDGARRIMEFLDWHVRGERAVSQ